MSVKVFDTRMQNFMKMLRSRGWTYAKIAKAVHCNRTTAMRYCKKY